jgi:hypothetical protein
MLCSSGVHVVNRPSTGWFNNNPQINCAAERLEKFDSVTAGRRREKIKMPCATSARARFGSQVSVAISDQMM